MVAVPRSAPTSFGALLIENYITTPGNSMIRRAAFDAVGNFAAGIEPCDDWDMNLRIARLGDFVFVDEVLLSWRRHSMSISNVSTRWRNAVMATRYRTIYSRENTPEQRMAARAAVRRDMKYLLKDAVAKALQGEFSSAPKEVGTRWAVCSRLCRPPRLESVLRAAGAYKRALYLRSTSSVSLPAFAQAVINEVTARLSAERPHYCANQRCRQQRFRTLGQHGGTGQPRDAIFDSEHYPLDAPRPAQIALSRLDTNVWLGHGPSRHDHRRSRRYRGRIDRDG